MTKLKLHPRVLGLLIMLGGAMVTYAVIAIGGMNASGRTGGKAIFLVGIAGIAAGVGLMQVLWPPAVAAEDDDRTGWQRANVLQKILYVVGGTFGVVSAAVLQTAMSGKI